MTKKQLQDDIVKLIAEYEASHPSKKVFHIAIERTYDDQQRSRSSITGIDVWTKPQDK